MDSTPDSKLNHAKIVGDISGNVFVPCFDWQQQHCDLHFRNIPNIKLYHEFVCFFSQICLFFFLMNSKAESGCTNHLSLLSLQCLLIVKLFPLTYHQLCCQLASLHSDSYISIISSGRLCWPLERHTVSKAYRIRHIIYHTLSMSSEWSATSNRNKIELCVT